ncbi:recombinase RecA [Reinekea sp. G2M2-21]|uniref:recombinase RecA n=1 Tax=Reinekea sp. G2M2-21 TaxID=2788942 RepID=UPI0018ABBBB9
MSTNIAGRDQALANALADINQSFGKNACVRMGDCEMVDVETISTGSLALDIALGVGGMPVSKISEIFGPESSGKTTLTLSLIAQAQKAGKTCAFIDAEHALDPVWAAKIGVKVDDLLLSQPDTGEQALEICDRLVRSNAVDLIVIDSVSALVPKSEIEGEIGDASVGVQARLMSSALRKITGSIAKAKAHVVFINQIRLKIGVMFGNPETTSGGNSLKFYSSVRLDIRRTGSIKDGDNAVANEVRVKVIKNKVAPPFKQANFVIGFGEDGYVAGINRNLELVELGVKFNIIEKSGAWYSFAGQKIGQGKVNAGKFFEDNLDVADEIEQRIRAAAKGLTLDEYSATVDGAVVDEKESSDSEQGSLLN